MRPATGTPSPELRIVSDCRHRRLEPPTLNPRSGRRKLPERAQDNSFAVLPTGTGVPNTAPGILIDNWRRKRDSNPRNPFEFNGFQDRRFQPLTHSYTNSPTTVALPSRE